MPEEKLNVFEDLIHKIPPDEGEVKLEIEDHESKIIKEEFLHLNNDAKVVSNKSGGLYKYQSMSGLNPPEDVSAEEKSIGINIHRGGQSSIRIQYFSGHFFRKCPNLLQRGGYIIKIGLLMHF